MLLFAVSSAFAAPDRTQQTRGQVEDDSNWGEAPAPIIPAAPASVGILPGQAVTPSRVVYVTPAAHSSHSQRSPAGGVKGGAAGGSYDVPAPHQPRQFVQSVATPLGLQCYLSNPNALQSLLAPASGEPQLVAVYDQPAPAPLPAVTEAPVRDQAVKSQYDGQRKTRYPARGGSAGGLGGSGASGSGSGQGDQAWYQHTTQQRAPQGVQQAKGYRQVSVVY